jgi:hypothetical protein
MKQLYKHINEFCNISLFYGQNVFCFIYDHLSKELPEDDLRKIETYWSFDGSYMKIYTILKFSAFAGVFRTIY